MNLVMQEMFTLVQSSPDGLMTGGVSKREITECGEIVRQAYLQEKMEDREKMMVYG